MAMKRNWMRVFGWALLLSLALPTFADETAADEPDAKEPAPEEDTILGQWYVQFMEDRVTPLDEQLRLVFEKTGVVRVFEGDGEDEAEEAMGFTYDEAKSTITIVEQDDPTDVEAFIKYSFIDDMLVMRISEDRGDDEEVIELTRKPEGTERHQKMRQEEGGGEAKGPGRRKQMQRMIQLRQLYTAVLSYQLDMDKPAASLGDVVIGGYMELDAALTPAAKKQQPKDFAEWKDKQKVDWINQRVGCVYLPTDLEGDATDKQIALIDLPATPKQETITLVFADGHSEQWEQKKANEEIKKQTGHTLEQWLKSTSPGSSKAPPKEKDE